MTSKLYPLSGCLPRVNRSLSLDMIHCTHTHTHTHKYSNILSPPWITLLLPTTPPAQPSQGPPLPANQATAQVPMTLRMTTSTCHSTMTRLRPISPLDSPHNHSSHLMITLDLEVMEITSFQACLLLSCLQFSIQEYP